MTGFSASLFCFLSSLLDGGVDGGASRLIRMGWVGRAGQPPNPPVGPAMYTASLHASRSARVLLFRGMCTS